MTVTALANIPSNTIPGGLTPLIINDAGASVTLLNGIATEIIEVWAWDLMTTGIGRNVP